MGTLDSTIVNIALPTISQAFHVPAGTVSWVATIYLLVMAGCWPILSLRQRPTPFRR
jgi:MFS family permease